MNPVYAMPAQSICKEDVIKHRYGCWSGNNAGNKYRDGYCAATVWGACRGMIAHQCKRKNGYGHLGLFCKQHQHRERI